MVAALPYTEAVLLSAYFEESAAYHYRIRKEQEAQASAPEPGMERAVYHTDDDEDDALYAEIEEELP